MRTKKILASVLAVLMLCSVCSVLAFAAEETPTEQPLKYTFTLTSGPTKTLYFDYEKFDPEGIIVTVTETATGNTVETVYYGEDTAYRFSFSPNPSKLLRVENDTVSVTLDGQLVEKVAVKVYHKYEEKVCLGKTSHGTKCFGCGDVPKDTLSEHEWKYSDDEAWEPNNDGTFTRDDTESNFCIVCGYEIKRDIDSTADYDVHFEEYQFLCCLQTGSVL